MAVEGNLNPENADKSQRKETSCSKTVPITPKTSRKKCSINHKLLFYNRNSAEILYSYLVTTHRQQIETLQ